MSCSCNKRSKSGIIIGVFVVFAVAAAIVSAITSLWVVNNDTWNKHEGSGGHQWLHEQLNLTNHEAAAIDAFEPEYQKQKEELNRRFNDKIEELRDLLINSTQYASEVEQTIQDLHVIHSQLQKLSIRHYFQMISVLPPNKQVRLKSLAGQALSVP